jgi:hypothetical protein
MLENLSDTAEEDSDQSELSRKVAIICVAGRNDSMRLLPFVWHIF